MIEQMNHPQGKTSELVERLRVEAQAIAIGSSGVGGVKRPILLDQAASELTRLEEENGKLRASIVNINACDANERVLTGLARESEQAEIKRLSALNVEAVGALEWVSNMASLNTNDAPTQLRLIAEMASKALLSRLQSGSENKDLAGVRGDLASASGVFSPENEAGDSAPHHTMCEDCPPYGYPTDKTRCLPCPRATSHDHTKGGA